MAKTVNPGKLAGVSPGTIAQAKIQKTVREMMTWDDDRLHKVVVARVRKLLKAPPRKFTSARLHARAMQGARSRFTGKRMPPRIEASIEVRTLNNLRAALRNVPSGDDGENWSKTIWAFMVNVVCKRWKLCDKIHEYDDEFSLMAALIGFLFKHYGIIIELELMTAVILLAWHRGPNWMCKCPKEPKKP